MIPGLAGFFAGGLQPITILDAWTTVSIGINSPGSKAVSAGSNRGLLAMASTRGALLRTVTGLAWGGEDMTLLEEETSTGGADLHTSLWHLNAAGIAAASGTAFGITSDNANAVEFRMHAASYVNLSQSSLVVDNFSSSSASAGDDPVASALTTVEGGLALGLIGINQGEASIDPDPDAAFSNMTELLELGTDNLLQLIGQAATDGSNFTPVLSTSHESRAHLLAVALRAA